MKRKAVSQAVSNQNNANSHTLRQAYNLRPRLNGPATYQSTASGRAIRTTCARQTITKTNDETTRHEAKHSYEGLCLLDLPREIRDHILREVLGDNLVHIRECGESRISRRSIDTAIGRRSHHQPQRELIPSDLCHLICDIPGAIGHKVSDHSPSIPAVINSDDPPCCSPGLFCSKQAKSSHTLDLGVLRICHQLCDEFEDMLWQRNTFSFDNPCVFVAFIKALSASQRHKLRNIAITVEVDRLDEPREWNLSSWELEKGDSKTVVGLRNVKTLHLHIIRDEMTLDLEAVDQGEIPPEKMGVFRSTMAQLRALRGLNLDKAEVTMDDERLHSVYPEFSRERLTTAQKEELATEFRAMLLNPHGAESLKLETKTLNLKAKILTSESAAADVRTAFQTLRQTEAHRDQLLRQLDELRGPATTPGKNTDDADFRRVRREAVEAAELVDHLLAEAERKEAAATEARKVLREAAAKADDVVDEDEKNNEDEDDGVVVISSDDEDDEPEDDEDDELEDEEGD